MPVMKSLEKNFEETLQINSDGQESEQHSEQTILCSLLKYGSKKPECKTLLKTCRKPRASAKPKAIIAKEEGTVSKPDLNPKKRLLMRHLKEIEDLADAPFGRGKNGKPLTRTPFVPSYMDPKEGPFLCLVCGYKASGLHYKVMACEGCKGFFRRTVQKNLKYTCKINNSCQITADNRTKCQQCRWILCLNAGMDRSCVLNDTERKAKNELITVNRAKREQAELNMALRTANHLDTGNLSESTDSLSSQREAGSQTESLVALIDIVTKAYETAFERSLQNVDDCFIPAVYCLNQVDFFVRSLPGVNELSPSEQSTLVEKQCLFIICLSTAFTYDKHNQSIRLPSGFVADPRYIKEHDELLQLWQFARRISDFQLSLKEKALLSSLALFNKDRPLVMESLYTKLLAALHLLEIWQELRNSKLLITIFPDLQTITERLFNENTLLDHHVMFNDRSTSVNRNNEMFVENLFRKTGIINQPCFKNQSSNSASQSSSIFVFNYPPNQM